MLAPGSAKVIDRTESKELSFLLQLRVFLGVGAVFGMFTFYDCLQLWVRRELPRKR